MPVRVQGLLIDQRTSRKMVIATVDIGTTYQIRNTMKRKFLRQKSWWYPPKDSTEDLNIS